MQPVAVRILHPAPTEALPLERALLEARARNAERLAELFRGAGATDVRVSVEAPDAASFGARLRVLVDGVRSGGLVVLGSGAVPLAEPSDVAPFVDLAGSGERRALANNRYSADLVAIGRVERLRDLTLPDLPGDNALPRWLEEVAGFQVADLRDRWWLAMDLDSPLDVVLAGDSLGGAIDLSLVQPALAGIRAVAADRRAEVVVAGRTSAATLAWLERSTASRIRALVEERGLRASSGAALAEARGDADEPPARRSRPPRSILALTLDDRGPGALGSILAELGDAAVIDTRVLLAHRLGVDERRWPAPEDRFASDLLLPELIHDPWLRDITTSVIAAPIPVLLGGHSLVGPGIRLALGDAAERGDPRKSGDPRKRGHAPKRGLVPGRAVPPPAPLSRSG